MANEINQVKVGSTTYTLQDSRVDSLVTGVSSVNGQIGDVTIGIPTVNNATLKIQKNGTNVATFTANASSNATANITVPTTASEVGALPISGGTITGTSGDTPLYIKSAHTTASYEGFQRADGTTLGYFGYSSKDVPAVYLSSGAKTIYHAGNLSLATTSANGLMSAADKTNLDKVSGINEIDLWYDTVYDLEVNEYGINWYDNFDMAGPSGSVLNGMVAMNVPIVAGSNISITKNSDGKAAITYTCGTWSSGTGGTVKLPSAGTYQVRYGTICSVLWWNGRSAMTSPLVRSNATGTCYRFSVDTTGAITLKEGKLSTTTETDRAYIVYYRRIGD